MSEDATQTVLLLGLRKAVIDEASQGLDLPGVQLIVANNIDDVRHAFNQTRIDHVIMGAGIDLDTRIEIIREIFHTSDTTTVHMKDHASGAEGFYPFIAAVLRGLHDYRIT